MTKKQGQILKGDEFIYKKLTKTNLKRILRNETEIGDKLIKLKDNFYEIGKILYTSRPLFPAFDHVVWGMNVLREDVSYNHAGNWVDIYFNHKGARKNKVRNIPLHKFFQIEL